MMVYEKVWMNDDLYNLLIWHWKHRHPGSPYMFSHMNPEDKLYGEKYVARWKMLKKLCKDAGVESCGYPIVSLSDKITLFNF